MNTPINEPRALFPGPDGTFYPDSLICSGMLPAELEGKPCPYAEHGRFPQPRPLVISDSSYSIDKGAPGDLCPPCAKQQLGSLGHWQGQGGLRIPAELSPLRLFKCRMWLWVVVPGLRDDAPQHLERGDTLWHDGL
jgi:hypothetical protein